MQIRILEMKNNSTIVVVNIEQSSKEVLLYKWFSAIK